jgi:thiol peroxidase
MSSITFKGKKMTLNGLDIVKGKPVHGFQVVNRDSQPVTLDDYQNKIKIITSFISLDTPVCDLQVKEFNKRAAEINEEVVILAISKDLPFAARRFCQMNGINNLEVLSDYKSSSFALNYGLLIEELNLLARSVLIVDKTNILRYQQIVPEVTDAPDYDKAIDALGEVIANPEIPEAVKKTVECTPCKVGTPPLPEDKVQQKLAEIDGWQLVDNKKIKKVYRRKNFKQTKYLLDLIAVIAQEQGHHPDMNLSYNKLGVSLTTHASDGLTDNDFIMAHFIDQLASK